jgi:hypothetical protein
VSRSMDVLSRILQLWIGVQNQAVKVRASIHIDFVTSRVSQITVAAAIVFGNERHTASQSYNYGNGSAFDGLFPRTSTQLSGLDAYADILRDWCLADDPICAANQPDPLIAAHLDYFNLYTDAAASWIKSIASLTDDSNFVTAIPTSISGTVQDYATVGTATPSGTVIIDTTWTEYTSVVSCTGASTVSQTANSTAASSSSVSSSPSQSQTSSSVSTSASQTTTTLSTESSAITTTPATVTSQITTRSSTSAVGTSSSSGIANSLDGSILLTISIVIIVSIYT